MADTVPRRQFLQAMGAVGTASTVSMLSNGLSSPANAQANLMAAPASAGRGPADLVLKNGKIITVDAAFTIAQAIAIAGERIVAVGPDAAMAAHIGPATRVIDLNGKTVIPGLTDGHAHMDREALRNVFPAFGPRALDQRHPGAHRRARARQAAGRVDRHHADRRSALLFRRARDSRGEALADARRSSMRRRPNNPVYIRSIWGYWRGTFPLVSCANTRGAQARRHHPRHRRAGRHA